MRLIYIEAISAVVPRTDVSLDVKHLVSNLDEEVIRSVIRPRNLSKIDRFTQIGLIVFERLKNVMTNDDPNKVGLFIGNDLGGWSYVQSQLEGLIRTGDIHAINPYVATAWFPAAAQGELSILHNIQGYSKTLSGGLLSSALALEHAAQRLLDGTVDLAFAGGLEAPTASATVDALVAEQRIFSDFPAVDAGCLFALRRPLGNPGIYMCISRPRRTPEAALDDIETVWCDSKEIDVYLPKVSSRDTIRSSGVERLRQIVGTHLKGKARFQISQVEAGDLGGAAFALMLASVITHFESDTSLSNQALVFGTDFVGLYIAVAVIRQ
ncbi:beta-ketoacyl synthase N-terminal-like domain-containing protein [Acetobacteraceae bacterium ESL0709]|nr:beta-ketoacyl synthase N-terminal-like domain-containing protein [Acetobacteraceae bacterium ESL0697]MDF7679066.1 beta-ketoacyl synthase N-terminal-like domain-containing protein [Acetobacteraceae bacterium ESL0709]